MMAECNGLTISKNICSLNFTPGRGCFSGPVAFVLHNVPFSASEYINMQATRFAYGESYFTPYPKSVHYFIGASGTIYQFVEDFDQSWGISELDGAIWPLLNTFEAFDNNEPFLHIGFEGIDPNSIQIDIASRLICCIALLNGIPTNEDFIIVGRDLDTKLSQVSGILWSVPPNLIEKANVCLINKGVNPIPADLGTLSVRVNTLEGENQTQQGQIDSLQQCCDDNTAAIAQLQADVATLQQEITDINVDEINQRLDALEEGNLEIQKILAEHQICINETCDPEQPECILYKSDYSTPIVLVPGAMQWLNLPIKITDTTPPTVVTGPLWAACLTQPCIYKVTGMIRLQTTDFCAGKKVELFVQACGVDILIAEHIATAGSNSVSIFGSAMITIPPECTDVHLEARTDDDTPNSPKTILEASIEICCVNGVLLPPDDK